MSKQAKPRKSAKQERREAWGRVEGGGAYGMTRILGMDISSTNVGICVLHDREPAIVKLFDLGRRDNNRDHRLRRLFGEFIAWIALHHHVLDGLAYEAPALTGKTGQQMNMITQAQAVGIVKAAWFAYKGGPQSGIVEVPIQHGKSALAGNYKAEKEEMIRCARMIAPGFDWNEHTADAFGIGLAAYTYLEQERQLAEYTRRMKEEAGDVI